MKPEHHQQIRVWISEEIAALRARGATDADMCEEAFIALVGEKILEHHWDEIPGTSPMADGVNPRRNHVESLRSTCRRNCCDADLGIMFQSA